MNWEDRFTTMVKESSAKIDEARRCLYSFDTSRVATVKNNMTSVLSPPAFQSTPQTRETTSLRSMRTNGLDDPLLHGSSGLLHILYGKIEGQSQEFDVLKSKVETLETELSSQQKEMQQFKEHLSQLVQKVENFKSVTGEKKLEEFQTEIRCELNKIKDCIPDIRNEDDSVEWKTTIPKRQGHHEKNSGQVINFLDEINSRLDKIESDLSSSYHNVEKNSKIVEKNVALLADWKTENTESMNRLCKLQDLSVDEVKHLRSNLYNVQDKIHELETSLNEVHLHNEFSTRRKSNRCQDDKNQGNISISSDEEESLSSVNLDDDNNSLEIDDFNLDDEERQKSQSRGSDLLNSSSNSLTASEDSLSEI